MQVHTFDSSSEAYDASQTNDAIKDGDVLSVPSERVVGILVSAWPCAVTTEHGQFHTLSEDVDWSAIPDLGDYTASYDAALLEALRLSVA